MKVIGLAGWSGAGKTTLLTRLIRISSPKVCASQLSSTPTTTSMSMCPARIPGFTGRPAQARCSCRRAAAGRWCTSWAAPPEPRLPDLLAKMSPVDLVVVEGFKSEPHPKIEVHRAANSKPLLYLADATIVGTVSDVEVTTSQPPAHLDDIQAIGSMILASAIGIEDVVRRL
jgi:molybdopterin-guanine dinucleotide biosynthesis adapter protein